MFSQIPLYAVCLAQVASAAFLHQGDESIWTPPKQTNEAELADKSSDAVSPVPTTRPEEYLAQMDLFRRQTQSLPDFTKSDNTCGYYVGFSTNSYTCLSSGQSCQIFPGNTRYRGCCSGTQCSTFATTCIPSSSLSSGQSCSSGTTCCRNSDNPKCGTIYFSSLARPSETQQIIQCWATSFDATYKMQDIPPSLLSTSTTTTSSRTTTTTTSSTTTTTSSSRTGAAVPGSTEPVQKESDSNAGSNNVGAIVGGVVGGVAGIALIVGAVVFILLRKKRANKDSPQPGVGFPQGGVPPGGPSEATPPPMMAGAYAHAPMSHHDPTKPPGQQQYYDPRYSYQPVSNPNMAGYPPSATLNGSPSPQPTYSQGMQSPGAYNNSPSAYNHSMHTGGTTPPQPYMGAAGVAGQHGQGYPMGPPSQFAHEMPADQPVGSTSNRAEMWSGPTEPTVANDRR